MGCGGDLDEENELKNKTEEQEPEGEEGEEEKEEEPTPDNTPYEHMKAKANNKAWDLFIKDMHERPASAQKEDKDEKTEIKGDVYRGSVNAKQQGEGWGVWVKAKTGDIYQGELMKGKEHGTGIMFWGKGKIEGIKMDGRWKNGKLEPGKSMWTYHDGSVYEGLQKNYKKDGKGTFTDKNGTKYEGLFKNDKKTDKKGKETSPDGTIYEGGFKNDLKDGVAKLTKDGKDVYQLFAKGIKKKDSDKAAFDKVK